MQSRDFEQLCEFMLRVNPLYDSSEGWRESSDDEAGAAGGDDVAKLETRSEQTPACGSRSIVMDLGRETVSVTIFDCFLVCFRCRLNIGCASQRRRPFEDEVCIKRTINILHSSIALFSQVG